MIEVDRLPTRDGKVNGVVKQKAPGGMAGNVAAALARLGSRVRVLGRVGDDADGAFAVESLEQVGVDTSFVSRLDGRRDIQLHQPADAGRGKVARQADDIRLSAGRRRCNGGGPGGRSPRASHLNRRPCPLSTRGGRCTNLPSDRLARHRARRLPGRRGRSARCDQRLRSHLLQCGVARLRGCGARAAACGARRRSSSPRSARTGAQVETAEGRIASPGFTPKIVDTTGAGDCFAAACLHARLAARLDWRDALRFANCAAAISTTGTGRTIGLADRRSGRRASPGGRRPGAERGCDERRPQSPRLHEIRIAVRRTGTLSTRSLTASRGAAKRPSKNALLLTRLPSAATTCRSLLLSRKLRGYSACSESVGYRRDPETAVQEQGLESLSFSADLLERASPWKRQQRPEAIPF